MALRNGFTDTTNAYVQLLREHCDHDADHIAGSLDQRHRDNLGVLGYGVKAYTISMVETAVELAGTRISPAAFGQIVGLGRSLLTQPVELLPGVADTLALLSGNYRLLLITKGDLLHQERKVAESGLAHHFAAVEVVSEKDPASYARVLRSNSIDPAGFVMVGNSVKSDVLPVLTLGAQAIHIPYATTWAHECVAHDASFPELSSITDLPAWLAAAVGRDSLHS